MDIYIVDLSEDHPEFENWTQQRDKSAEENSCWNENGI